MVTSRREYEPGRRLPARHAELRCRLRLQQQAPEGQGCGEKALVAFVQRGVEPPRSGFVPKPKDEDVVNECSIEATAPRR
jgi:hypothetical protein